MVRQRVYGLALGYEDVNDHDHLRHDPLFHVFAGTDDLDAPLAGKSTLNRVEASACVARRDERYHRVRFHADQFQRLLVDLFVESLEGEPRELVIDLDATDLPLHGAQEGRHFHGYYKNYCYLPLYITCGEHVLHARLRPSSAGAAEGAVEALCPIVGALRARLPHCRLIVRGDSAFSTEEIMSWCEERGVGYTLGLARNARLQAICARRLEQARRRHLRTGEAARLYKSFAYRTRRSWSRKRRVVAKCEHIAGKSNPRFVVTNLLCEEMASADLYERGYCPRGDMENRIKEQLDLFAGRVSCEAFAANQLRLAFSTMAHGLLVALRRALAGTELARAQVGQLRVKVLKVGALVKRSARRILVRVAEGYPWKSAWIACARALGAKAPPAAA
jgi:hypothetical protein